MSRGHGRIQDYLTNLIDISPAPLTFNQILAIAYPPGSYESDLAKICGGSNVGKVRSLRRALKRLCDDGTIMEVGMGGRGDPHRYVLNPLHNSDGPHAVHLGELLLEARCQMPHRQFCEWVKREFNMSPAQAEQFIDFAYQARRHALAPQGSHERAS